MEKKLINFILLFLSFSLTACSSNSPVADQRSTLLIGAEKAEKAEKVVPMGSATVAGGPIGGSIEKSMDEADKLKMSHAMDKAPGKSTHWVNENTGISYTVVPIKKVVINGNPYCREYNTTALRANKEKQVNGTACVGPDGNWQAI